MSPKIPVRSKKHSVKDPTHMALMVDSLSQEEISTFDVNKVKEALLNEDIPEQEAHDISVEVEEKLRSFVLTYNVKSVDTSFIRSFVNLVLAEKGYSKQLRSRKEFVLSHEDITQIIENSNNENGNTEHNPESINLTLAGLALKNYSFKNIFSKDIVQAHLEGKLHVHDADYPTRAYAFDGQLCQVNSSEFGKISIEDLYHKFEDHTLDEKSHIVRSINVEVCDKDTVTHIKNIIKIEEQKDIYEVVTACGHRVYITEEHPCMVFRNGCWIEIPLFDVVEGDEVYVQE